MRRLSLLFTALVLALCAGCSAPAVNAAPVASSETFQKLGVLTYSTLDEPAGLNEVELAELQTLRLRALNEAVAAVDRAPDWQAADREVTRLYASPAFGDDLAAQQLISVALLKGKLLEQPSGTAVDARILHHVAHLVGSGGVDSATIHAGLARSPDTARATALSERAAVAIQEHRLVAEGKLCSRRLPRRRES